jgi:hypothetical protein
VNARVWLVVVALVGCKDHGTAKQVSPPPEKKPVVNAPEPPGGPPSCADVAAHLAAALAMPAEINTEAKGAKVTISGDTMKQGIEQGMAQVCREQAWTLDGRKCALTWQGNILRERASLRDACPGTLQ